MLGREITARSIRNGDSRPITAVCRMASTKSGWCRGMFEPPRLTGRFAHGSFGYQCNSLTIRHIGRARLKPSRGGPNQTQSADAKPKRQDAASTSATHPARDKPEGRPQDRGFCRAVAGIRLAPHPSPSGGVHLRTHWILLDIQFSESAFICANLRINSDHRDGKYPQIGTGLRRLKTP
jgi:hypothetical protein